MGRLQPHVGRTLLEIFWEELDDIMDRLMEDEQPDVADFDDGKQYQAIRVGEYAEAIQGWAEERGQAQGVAYCIAVMTNPYTPDIDGVREQAMQRWERRYASDG